MIWMNVMLIMSVLAAASSVPGGDSGRLSGCEIMQVLQIPCS